MSRHSRKRDAILNQLSDRYDHPTAETLYAELKDAIPDLSLATVYRNLKQLEEWGELISITTEGATRFDRNVRPHSHFFCRKCGSVKDLDNDNEAILAIGQQNYAGLIENCASNFYGVCPECLKAGDVKKI